MSAGSAGAVPGNVDGTQQPGVGPELVTAELLLPLSSSRKIRWKCSIAYLSESPAACLLSLPKMAARDILISAS